MKTDYFHGICPLCYKPMTSEDDLREIATPEGKEVYHMACIKEWVNERTPPDADTQAVGMMALEMQASIFLGYNRAKREMWIAQQTDKWTGIGRVYQEKRDQLGISRRKAAEALGISPSRLGKFENGDPVRDAKLIENAYRMFLDLSENQIREGQYQ
jgi:ribosome-binding protein aMBF1 (putative translation factor)